MRAALVLLAGLGLGACNRAFDIVETQAQPDAPPPVDTDGDGVFDLDDNCPLVSNDQSDKDHDLVGDRCDNCPLLSNPSQDARGDGDDVGAACDPHPEADGDCLVLFESFADPATFATHWSVYAGAAPTIETRPGSVTVTPADTNYLALAARDDSGALLTGNFDTEIAATVTLTMGGELYAASNIPENTTYGYGCGVFWYTAGPPGAASRDSHMSTGTSIITPSLFGDPVTPSLFARLTVPSSAVPTIKCRVDYGDTVGSSKVDTYLLRSDGAPGMVMKKDAATFDAVGFYRVQSAPCETTYR